MASSKSTTFFRNFYRSFINSNILNSFNSLIDGIEWEKDKNEAIENFAGKLGNKQTHDLVMKIYNEKLNAYNAKSIALESSEEYKIEIDKEEFLGLYHKLDENEKKFVQFIFISPKLLYLHYIEKFMQGIFTDGFSLYLENVVHDGVDDECLFGQYSIIDCITNPSISSSLLTDINDSEITNADLFWSHLDLILSYGKTTGNDSITSFEKAFNIIQRIAPTWNQLKISSQTMNDAEVDINVPVTDKSKAVDDIDTIISAFQGNYSVIPSDYPKAKSICFGLISNFINFNKLSNDRKLQVSNYLLNNRSKFNNILQTSCKIVSDSIARDCEKMSSLDFSKYGIQDISKIGYSNEGDNLAKNVSLRIKKSFSQVGDNVMQKMNYLTSCFIPLMNKFKSEVLNKYGKDSYKVFEKINNDMKIFGGSIYDNVEIEEIEVIETIPVVATVEEKSPVVQEFTENPFDEIYKIRGGDFIEVKRGPEYSPEDLIKETREAQLEFNKEYEIIYRQLIKDLENIQFTNIYESSFNKIDSLIKVFDDIAIKVPKTTVYLSGLYGKKNRNRAYTTVVNETIKTLKNSGIPVFTDTIRTLEKLSKLLKDSAVKANEIRSKFIKSPKAKYQILKVEYNVKIPCKLTSLDFNNFDEAINRLYWQLSYTRSESNILNIKDELQRYLDKAKNREGMIREQFNINLQDIEYSASRISNSNLRNLYIQNKKLLNDQLLKSTLYINNIVETYLTKQKMKEVESRSLTREEIKNIENAILIFNDNRNSTKYHEEFVLLNKLVNENRNIFEIADQFAKILASSRYIEFLATIYRELKIFSENFDWDEFTRNMIRFITFSSLDIETLINLPEAVFEGDNVKFSSKKQIRTLSNWISNISWVVANKIDQVEYFNDVNAFINTLASVFDFYNKTDLKFVNVIQSDESLKQKLAGVLSKFKLIGTTGDVSLEPLDTSSEYNNIYTKLFGISSNFVEAYNEKYDSHKINDDAQKKYFTKILSTTISEAFGKIDEKDLIYSNVGVRIIPLTEECDNTKLKNTNTIIQAIFDSFILNIVNVVDKYWAIRYHGKLDLPINVEMMIKGGNIFDAAEFHDISNAKVIPEAVPFYISALNICYYYITQFTKKTSTSEFSQKLQISKISLLYPIYQIFTTYDETPSNITTARLNTCVGILNEIWNQTTGSNENKLSASIDIILNELNASMFISNGFENLGQTDGIATRLLMNDVDKIIEFITKTINNSLTQSYSRNSINNEKLSFEHMMKRSYHKIRDVPETQRLIELKAILNSREIQDYSMNEYYKFMDLVIAPLFVCYDSYNRVFQYFDIFSTQFESATGYTIDLEKYEIDFETISSNLWKLINEARNNNSTFEKCKDALKYHPAVQLWNTIQYMKIFEKYLDDGKLTAPDFWYPSVLSSYPRESKASYNFKNVKSYTYGLHIFKPLFGTVNAKNLRDYFEFAIREFVSDLDQVLHVFMSYPGMSDGNIELINKFLHDNVTYEGIMKDDKIKERLELFQTIPITKDRKFVNPNIKYSSLSPFTDNESVIPEITIFDRYVEKDTILPSLHFTPAGTVSIDGSDYDIAFGPSTSFEMSKPMPTMKAITSVNISSSTQIMDPKGGSTVVYPVETVRNGWTEFVVYYLSKCHPYQQIPYKFVQLMQSNTVIGQFAKSMLNVQHKSWNYAIFSSTHEGREIYNNPIVQNIIARSCVDSNRNISDYVEFGQSAINNLVSIIPYLISMVSGARNTIEPGVTYCGVRVIDECSALIDILSKFYNEISSSISPISYLQNGSSSFEANHPIGEIVCYLDKNLGDIKNYSVLEFANKYKFADISAITYPNFKNKDSFEWVHKFSENIFNHPVFNANFNIIIENMGKQLWNAVIANTSMERKRSTFPGYNEKIINVVRNLLRIWIQTGEDNKNKLQYLFDELFNSIKPDLESQGVVKDYNVAEAIFGGEPDVFKEIIAHVKQELISGYNTYDDISIPNTTNSQSFNDISIVENNKYSELISMSNPYFMNRKIADEINMATGFATDYIGPYVEVAKLATDLGDVMNPFIKGVMEKYHTKLEEFSKNRMDEIKSFGFTLPKRELTYSNVNTTMIKEILLSTFDDQMMHDINVMDTIKNGSINDTNNELFTSSFDTEVVNAMKNIVTNYVNVSLKKFVDSELKNFGITSPNYDKSNASAVILGNIATVDSSKVNEFERVIKSFNFENDLATKGTIISGLNDKIVGDVHNEIAKELSNKYNNFSVEKFISNKIYKDYEDYIENFIANKEDDKIIEKIDRSILYGDEEKSKSPLSSSLPSPFSFSLGGANIKDIQPTVLFDKFTENIDISYNSMPNLIINSIILNKYIDLHPKILNDPVRRKGIERLKAYIQLNNQDQYAFPSYIRTAYMGLANKYSKFLYIDEILKKVSKNNEESISSFKYDISNIMSYYDDTLFTKEGEKETYSVANIFKYNLPYLSYPESYKTFFKYPIYLDTANTDLQFGLLLNSMWNLNKFVIKHFSGLKDISMMKTDDSLARVWNRIEYLKKVDTSADKTTLLSEFQYVGDKFKYKNMVNEYSVIASTMFILNYVKNEYNRAKDSIKKAIRLYILIIRKQLLDLGSNLIPEDFLGDMKSVDSTNKTSTLLVVANGRISYPTYTEVVNANLTLSKQSTAGPKFIPKSIADNDTIGSASPYSIGNLVVVDSSGIDERNRMVQLPFSFNVEIMDLLSNITGKNIRTFIELRKAEESNLGFISPWVTMLTGGCDCYDQLIVKNNNGLNPFEVLRQLYPSTLITFDIYKSLFNDITPMDANDNERIFNAIMNYFHKFNIGMSSVFGNICYAQILNNHVLLKSVINNLGVRIKDEDFNKALDKCESDKLALQITYLKQVVENSPWNDAKNWEKLFINTDDKKKIKELMGLKFDEKESINKVLAFKPLKDNLNGLVAGVSLNQTFRNNFINNTIVREISKKEAENEKIIGLHKFLFSNAFRHMKELDMKMYFVQSLMTILSLTSYHDSERNIDIAFGKIGKFKP